MSVNNGFDWNKTTSQKRQTPRQKGRRGFGAMPRSPSETLEPMRAAEPPIIHRKKREYHQTLVFMSGTLTTIVLLLILVSASFGFAKYLYDKEGPLQHSELIVIPKGEGLSAIADRLERKNMIIDKRLFKAAVMYFGVQNKLKAGEYEIPKLASMRQVLDHLLEGKSILHDVPFPEGFTSQQIAERLNAHEALTGELAEIPAEGSMLPDTYKFTRGMDRNELVKRMQAAQEKFLNNLWQQRKEDLPIKTREEALILASIVEKETGIAGERPHIAGVFINRLNKGMRLQSDPTIIYGLVGGVGKLGRGLRRSEIDQKTEYNTYQIDGLPPTPIANPGRAAIEAVLNPKETEDLYFVADGTGGHIFAKTLKDHQNNVRNWRKIEQERLKAAEEEAARAAKETEDKSDADNSEQPDQKPEKNSSADDIFDNLELREGDQVALQQDQSDGSLNQREAALNNTPPLPLKK